MPNILVMAVIMAAITVVIMVTFGAVEIGAVEIGAVEIGAVEIGVAAGAVAGVAFLRTPGTTPVTGIITQANSSVTATTSTISPAITIGTKRGTLTTTILNSEGV